MYFSISVLSLQLNIWASEKCVPLVREITFENAEELTEEGLPFLILFHRADDTESIKKYKDVINRELVDEKRKMQDKVLFFIFLKTFIRCF